MKTNISNDLVVRFNDVVIDVAAYENYGKEDLELSIDKLFYLRDIAEDRKKVIEINIVKNLNLPIKKNIKTRCFLTTEFGDVLTDSLELDIFSINEANKYSESNDELINLLKYIDKNSNEDVNIYNDLKLWMDNFLNKESFKKIFNNGLNE